MPPRRKHRRTLEGWPHGLPTKPCETCAGAGLSKTATAMRVSSSSPTTKELERGLQCGACQGRGRVLAQVTP
jgi:DnaJ-class molecular chaperone